MYFRRFTIKVQLAAGASLLATLVLKAFGHKAMEMVVLVGAKQ